MHHFMWRATTAVLVVLAAFAFYANAQAPSNTSSNANINQPNVQPTAGATNAPQPGAVEPSGVQPGVVQPSATQPAPTAQKQVVPNIQPQVNPNAARQRDLLNLPRSQGQLATPIPTGRVQGGVRDGLIQTDQGTFTGRAVLPNQQFLRQQALLPTKLRGPDFGLWFSRPVRDGLIISDIGTIGPITRLGFREGDRIVSVNGHSVVTERQFVDFLLTDAVNPVQVVVFRNGRNETVVVDPAILNQQQTFVAQVEPLEQFGIVLDDRFNDRIVVWRVLPGTPAFYAGFRPGDVITTLSGQPFRTRIDFENAIVGLRAGEIPVSVLRGNRPRDLVVDVPQFQRTAQLPEIQPGQSRRVRLDGRGTMPSDQRQAQGIQPRGSDSVIDQRPENRPAQKLPDAQRGERR